MNLTGMNYEQMEAHFKAEDERLAREMPDEAAAMRVMFDAWNRLKQLGWNDIDYCPKDGSVFESISAGCTGIHPCHYEGTWPKGSWWVADGGDLWPARPILFRKTNPPAAPAHQEHTMDKNYAMASAGSVGYANSTASCPEPEMPSPVTHALNRAREELSECHYHLDLLLKGISPALRGPGPAEERKPRLAAASPLADDIEQLTEMMHAMRAKLTDARERLTL